MSRHALVIGASIAGLTAARVLSDHFEKITVVERDPLPASPAYRRHVPQSRHIHALLIKGREVLNTLYPGFDEELRFHGAHIGDPAQRSILMFSGHRHCQRESGLRGALASRLLIEDRLRSRTRSNPRITIADGAEALGLLSEGHAVTGLRVRDRGGTEQDWRCDLVVDCSGRGSRTPAWLETLGFAPPDEEQLRMDMRYKSRHFRLPPNLAADPFIIVIGPTPRYPRGGVMAYQDGGLYLCTLAGYSGDICGDDLDSYLRFAQNLVSPALYDILRASEAVDDAHPYGMPSNLRRRYERLRSFPKNLLVLGDAVCSFDPLYGQGMTVSILEAQKLGEWLSGRSSDARRWFGMIAPIVDTPWEICTGGDAHVLGLPQARRGAAGMINRYLDRLHACATTDRVVADAFLQVSHLLQPKSALLRPSILWRVLRGPRPHALDDRAATPQTGPGRT